MSLLGSEGKKERERDGGSVIQQAPHSLALRFLSSILVGSGSWLFLLGGGPCAVHLAAVCNVKRGDGTPPQRGGGALRAMLGKIPTPIKIKLALAPPPS